MAVVTIGEAANPSADYPDWDSMAAGENNDLTGTGGLEVQYFDDWPGGNPEYAVLVSDALWTTTPTDKLTIEPVPGAEHGGIENNGFYFSTTAAGNPFYIFRFELDNVVVRNIQVTYGQSSSRYGMVFPSNNHRVTMEQCLMIQPATASGGSTVNLDRNRDGDVFERNMFIGRSSGNAPFQLDVRATALVGNNDWIGETGAYALETNPGNTSFAWAITADNNLFYVDLLSTRVHAEGGSATNNAFKQGIDRSVGANRILDVTDADFVSAATDNYKPAAGSTKLVNTGSAVPARPDLAGDAYVTADIGCLVAEVGAPEPEPEPEPGPAGFFDYNTTLMQGGDL